MVEISVIMPTAREAKSIIGLPIHYLEPTLRSLSTQSFTDFEFIIVDCLYEHRPMLFEGLQFDKNDYGFPIHHIPVYPNHRYWLDRGKWAVAGTFNSGIIEAEGSLLVRLDDCSEFDPGYLRRIWDEYQNNRFLLAMHTRYRNGSQAYYDEDYKRNGYDTNPQLRGARDSPEFVKEVFDKIFGGGKPVRDTRWDVVIQHGGKMVIPDDWPWYYGYCYDDKTEVLTEDGFKFFKDVTSKDKIATLSPKGVLEYHRPQEQQVYRYKGPLLHWAGRHIDLAVTPNHRLYVRSCYSRSKGFFFIEAKDFLKRDMRGCEMKKDAIWNGIEVEEYELPRLPDIKFGHAKFVGIIKMDAWLKFLGWWLSEGTLSKNGRGSYVVSVSQKRGSPYLEEIISCITQLGINPGICQNKSTEQITVKVSRKQFYMILQPLGKARSKYVPDYIKKLSSRQIRIFLETFCKGDGSYRTDPKTNQPYMALFYTASKRLADDIQELLLKIGLSGTVLYRPADPSVGRYSAYQISVCHKKLTPQVWSKPQEVMYDGQIYDLTVPNHLLFVRRNGKVVWSGNSSLSMDAALKVNGLDESYDGRKGQEDQDLGSRLVMAGYRGFFVLDVNHWVIEHEHYPASPNLIKSDQKPGICNYGIYLLNRVRNMWRANAERLTRSDAEWIRDKICPSCGNYKRCLGEELKGSFYTDEALLAEWLEAERVFSLREERLSI